MPKKFDSSTVVTWNDLNHSVNAVAKAVIPLCDTSTDGIEDWLSAAATNYKGTVRKLASEWDKLSAKK